MGIPKVSSVQILGLVVTCCLLASPAQAKTRYYNFVIKEASYTRLCHTKNILTVNGQFPGPTIYANKGDTVIVKVANQGNMNVTLHWHGVRMLRNPWSDGPEYITQCPIQPGANFTQVINLTDEEGTLWWHAHSDWTRATVHGAIVIHPRPGTTFPFPKPCKEFPIILSSWWISDVNQVLQEALRSGGDMNVSNAHTINGQPGDLYPCSKPGTYTVSVEQGETYLLRVVGSLMNAEQFFAVAGHKLTVVGTDASYTKPYTVDYIFITPGQTMDLLLTADQPADNRYYIAARGYNGNPVLPLDNTTTTAILQYVNPADGRNRTWRAPPKFPFLPAINDTNAAARFTAGLRSLASKEHPTDVPQTVDERLLITVSGNVLTCAPSENCTVLPIPNARTSASLNNISFGTPTSLDILQAYYRGVPGVYGTNFPNEPPLFFDFTADNLSIALGFTVRRTEVKVFEFNTSVEIVFQGTNLLGGADNHPMHQHGYSFYTVGMGFGNWDKRRDPRGYNLVDPPRQNTVGLPVKGWVAIRFRTTNPGVWFQHCHIDRHLVWGMSTALIVKDGPNPQDRLLPPPPYMPPC